MKPDADAPPRRAPVLTELRIERETTPDGRTVLYFSWPRRTPRHAPARDV